MEPVSISETSDNFYSTRRRKIPEKSYIHEYRWFMSINWIHLARDLARWLDFVKMISELRSSQKAGISCPAERQSVTFSPSPKQAGNFSFRRVVGTWILLLFKIGELFWPRYPLNRYCRFDWYGMVFNSLGSFRRFSVFVCILCSLLWFLSVVFRHLLQQYVMNL